MPRTIRQTLTDRLLKSPRAAAYLRDFSAATGLPLRFATPLGQETPISGSCPAPAACEWMRGDPQRNRLCGRTIQDGALRAAGAEERASPCGVLCAAGLREASVPLRMGGEIFGYLLVGQVATRPLDRPALNRWRHALEREGQRVQSSELDALARSVKVVTDEQFAAAVRLLESGATQLVNLMEDHLTQHPDAGLSPPLRRACAYIRANFDQPMTLGEVAAEVGVSREYFCTIFHKGTGLRFVEYLTRIRVEHAGELLRNGKRSVADVAFACGFQSISHFNRCFRAINGQTPSAWRKAAQPADAATDTPDHLRAGTSAPSSLAKPKRI